MNRTMKRKKVNTGNKRTGNKMKVGSKTYTVTITTQNKIKDLECEKSCMRNELVESNSSKEASCISKENVNSKPKIDNEDELFQPESSSEVPERLTQCPWCEQNNIYSSVERLTIEEGKYWVSCTRRDGCGFLEEFSGRAIASESDLTMYGLPGQLVQHMTIFREDIQKIFKFCMYEYLKVKYLGSIAAEYDFKAVKDLVRFLDMYHGDGYMPLSETVQKTMFETSNRQNLVDYTQHDRSELKRDITRDEEVSSQLYDCQAKVQTFVAPDDFDETCKINQTNKSHLTAGQDLDLFQNTTDDILQAVETNDAHPLLPSKKMEKCLRLTGYDELYASVKNLADSLVEDLSLRFQEKIKEAFSKVEDYNFPFDFVQNVSSKDFELFKVLEEKERQEQIQKEVEKQLDGFLEGLDDFDSIL